MSNRLFTLLLIAICGGALTFALFIEPKILNYMNVGGSISESIKSSETTPSVSITPTVSLLPVDFWQKIANDSALSSAVIQTFNDKKFLKQGSGIILSSDGIVATTADAVSGGQFFQFLYDDKILKALILTRESVKNIALLKVEAYSLNITALSDYSDFQSGRDYLVAGKFANLSQPVLFSQKAMLSYVQNGVPVLDTAVNSYVNGAKVIDSAGRVAGMAYIRSGRVYVISAVALNDFFKSYLNKSQ